MEVIQAYDTILPPQVIITLPAILPPSPVLSLSPMFDSQDLFLSKEISPKDIETPVESPILVPPSSSEGSSSPVRVVQRKCGRPITHMSHKSKYSIHLAILPPSPVLSLSPMFDSQDLFLSKEISPKDIETLVESPIPVPPSSSEGSSSPVRSTTPDYPFDKLSKWSRYEITRK
nr:hypothetical protein [Tanacetum cinerariifolium]